MTPTSIIPSEWSAMNQIGFPVLSILIAVPFIFAFLLAFVQSPRIMKRVTLLAVLIELAISCFVFFAFDPNTGGFQFTEKYVWIESIGVSYHLGIDGISVLCLPMTAMITLMILMFSWKSREASSKLYCIFLLALQAITMGIFSSLDLILFFLFWEFMLVPIFFMIHLWGVGSHRSFAALKYVLYMLAASAPLLTGFVLLAIHHNDTGAGYSFNLLDLMNMPLTHTLQAEIFFLLFIGFAVKAPLFPMHTWLPMVLEQGPIGVGIVMVGIKLGIYGFARFLIPLLPSASVEWQWPVFAVATIGVIYGALVALVQSNLKRLLAYSGLSHVSLIVLGLFSFHETAMQGAILQMANLGIISTVLFFLAGSISARTGSSDFSSLGGLASRAPWLTFSFLLFSLASLGFPGTSGFIGEHLILLGTFQTHAGFAIAGLLGIVLGGAYIFNFYERAFLGPVTRGAVDRIIDLRPRELMIVSLCAFVLFWVGLRPQRFLHMSEKSIHALYTEVMNPPVTANIDHKK